MAGYCNFRYILFGFDEYYPCGGFQDFIFGFNDIEEFKKSLTGIKDTNDYYFIVDLSKLENVQILGYCGYYPEFEQVINDLTETATDYLADRL